jgi:hypothetical protein
LSKDKIKEKDQYTGTYYRAGAGPPNFQRASLDIIAQISRYGGNQESKNKYFYD